MAQEGPKPPAPPAIKAPPPPPAAGKGPIKSLGRGPAIADQETKLIEKLVHEAEKMANEKTSVELKELIAQQEPLIGTLLTETDKVNALIKPLKQRAEEGDARAKSELIELQKRLAELKADPAPLIKQQAIIALLIQEANAIKAVTQSNNKADAEKAKADLRALIEYHEKENIRFRKEQYNPLSDKISKKTQKRQEVVDQVRTESSLIKAQIEQLTKESAVLEAQRQEFAGMDPDFLAEIDVAILNLAARSERLADLLKTLPNQRKVELQRMQEEIDELKIQKDKLDDSAILFKSRSIALQSFKEEKLSRTINLKEWTNIIQGIFYHNLRKFIAFADDNIDDIAPNTVFEAYNDLAKQKGFDETVILAIAAGNITRNPNTFCKNRRSPKIFLSECDINPRLEPVFNKLLTKFYAAFPHFAQTAGLHVLAQPAAAQAAAASPASKVNMPGILQHIATMVREEGPERGAPEEDAQAAPLLPPGAKPLRPQGAPAPRGDAPDAVAKLGQRPAQDIAARLDQQRAAADKAAVAGDRALGVQYGKVGDKQALAQAAKRAIGDINKNLQLAQREFDAFTKLSSRVDELSEYLLKEVPETMRGDTIEARLQRAQVALEQAATPERILERERVGGFESAYRRYRELHQGKAPTPQIMADWQRQLKLSSSESTQWREKTRKPPK